MKIKLKYCLLPLLMLWSCTNDDFFITDKPVENTTQIAVEQRFEQGYMRLLVADDLSDKLEEMTAQKRSLTMAISDDEAVKDIKIHSVQRTFPHAGRFEERTRKAGLHLWYDIEFDVEVPLCKAESSFQNIKGVKKVEYRPEVARYWNDEVYEFTQGVASSQTKAPSALRFNDPMLSSQWHYQNDGSLGSNYKVGADINLFNAWNYTTGSPDVVVAIIDGGIDYTHEDLAANMWVNEKEKNGSSSVDDDKNGYTDDIHGYNFVSNIGKLVPHDHGTHVAGTIAAVNNNGKGVSGIAGGNGSTNSGVKLMSCQIFVDEDDPYSSQGGRKGAPAIKYAADNGAVICQNSWGYPTLTTIPASDKAAIDYFIQYAGIDEHGKQTGAMRGGIVIFAAGNEDREAAAPANYEKVVAVSSIAPDYKKAYYSNYGSWIDLAAPGGDMKSFGSKGSVLSTVVGGYGYMQGTSMACPHVSGVAALALSHFKKTGYNADMLRARLENSATNIDSYNSSYKGRLGKLVNAQAALAGGSTKPPANITSLTGTVNSNTVTLKWAVPSDPDDGKASGFNVYYRTSSLSGFNVNNPPADVMINSYPTGNLNAGDLIEVDVKDLDFETTYYFVVNAFDFSGNFSGLSPQFSATTLSNHPPVIQVIDSADVVMKAHENVNLQFEATDPDNHDLYWSIINTVKGVELIDLGYGKAQITITGVKCDEGKQNFTLKVEDEYGLAHTQIVNFDVLPNHAPEIVNTIEDIYMGQINNEIVLNIEDYFIDPDGEKPKFTFTNTNPAVVHINESKGKLYVVSLSYGIAEIIIKATDAKGLSVSQVVNVLVRDDDEVFDLYPNPVMDYLWIRTATTSDFDIEIYNQSGATIFKDKLNISPFVPAQIDMKEHSGGVYNLRMNIDGKVIIKQFVKL